MGRKIVYTSKGPGTSRVAKAAVAASALGALVLGATSGVGATVPAGGAIQVWGTPANNGGGTVVITGAVADSGKAIPANSSGKPAKKGTYKILALKKGTILINTTQLGKNLNNANPTGSTFNMTTCSGYIPVTTPVPIIKGTKAYQGISGSVSITVTFVVVIPLQKGKCNTSQSGPNPSAQYSSIAGTGTVSFSG